MAVWSACDIYDTYRTEGPEAALIQAGTEVVVTAAGIKAFKIAGRVFYTAEAAWGAYLIENPRMAAIAEYCVEQGGKAKGFALEQGAKLADYVKSTGAGKFVSSINAKVEAKFAQWFGNKEVIDAGVKWGGGNMEQGMPWEDYLARTLPEGSRLPQNFKTFDFYDRITGTATSAKTLNTQTASNLANPDRIYQTLKRYVDKTINYSHGKISGYELNATDITSRVIELAVPKSANAAQLQQIARATDYAKLNNIIFNVRKVS